jgi:hypothetical protein
MYVKYHRAHPLHQHFACTHAADGACSCTGHPTHGDGGCKQMILQGGKKVTAGGECVTTGSPTSSPTLSPTASPTPYVPPVPQYTVKNIAGWPGSNSYRNGDGSSARFDSARGIDCIPSKGLCYIADENNNAIRTMTMSAPYTVTTLAGGGKAAGCGTTDGIGTGARFCEPAGIAVDAANDVAYVGEKHGHSFRKVDLTTGEVTTLAGVTGQAGAVDGQGSDARFNGIYDIKLDLAQRIAYVSERFNNCIRKVNLDTFDVTTLAGKCGTWGNADGTTTGRFNANIGLTLDLTKGLGYVVEHDNQRLCKVDLSTGEITTIAGGDGMGSADGQGRAAKFRYPWYITLDPSDSDVAYVSQEFDIRKVVLSTGDVTRVTGADGQFGNVDAVGTAARWKGVTGMYIDAATNVMYVNEGAGKVVRTMQL